MATKRTKEKCWIDQQHGKRVRRTRRSDSRNTHRFTQTNSKKLNWKMPRYDGIHRFRFKKFTTTHDRPALEMSRWLQEAEEPEWRIKEKSTMMQKNFPKEIARSKYRPLMRPPMMWKISTAQIMEGIYSSLSSRGLFPEEQKGYCKGYRGTGELLNIDQHILNKNKTDYKKIYYMSRKSQ